MEMSIGRLTKVGQQVSYRADMAAGGILMLRISLVTLIQLIPHDATQNRELGQRHHCSSRS